MKIPALSSLYRQSFSVILGIGGLLVLLGVEVCVPACTEIGVRARSCETVQVVLMEGMAWCGDQGVRQLRGVATFARLRMTHRDIGRTLLHYAVAASSREGTWSLVTLGANRNARTVQDKTPLHYAGGEQSAGAVTVLLRHGADPNARDVWGNTALHHYGEPGLTVTNLLLQHGADPNARNADGDTPLHNTLNPHVAILLLQYGADPDLRNKEGLSPMDVAVVRDNLEVAKLLRDQVD